MTKSNNSPAKVISRLMHRDKADYFQHLGIYSEIEFWPSIFKHISKCQHSFCKGLRRHE